MPVICRRYLLPAPTSVQNGILAPSRPREDAKLGKLTIHGHPTEIAASSVLPPERFHTTETLN
jgi:hypothetical protein